MKLFLVVYILGNVAATVGPLPTYGDSVAAMDSCKRVAASDMTSARKAFAMGKRAYLKGELITPADIKMKCEFHKTRPVNHEMFN
jgi:hypothetical protein